MHADRLIANSLAANAEIYQTFTHFSVLAAPFHALIETVDAKNVGLPTRGVVTIPSGLGRRDNIKQFGQPRAGGYFQQFRRPFQSVRAQPTCARHSAMNDVLAFDFLA